MPKTILILVLCSALISFAYAGWDIQTVDAIWNVGQHTSIALDSANRPHISYYDALEYDLKYARWDGSTWRVFTLDSTGDVGYATSIAIDSSDYPHISYYDATNDDLKYAHWTGTEWQIRTVDSLGYVGFYSSLALDSNDCAHISYYDSGNGDLEYARWSGLEWLIQTVDSSGNVGQYTSIALDANDNPHISYYDFTNKDLKYSRWDGSTWQTFAIDSDGDVGSYTSLALDGNNYPHISYYDAPNGDLRYARWIGSVWETQTVDSQDDVGKWTSIVLDIYNYPHISYHTGTTNDLKYAWWNGFEWKTQTVDTEGNVGTYTSLALDANNLAYISYYDGTNGDLEYAHWSPIVGYYFSTGNDGWTSSGQVLPYNYPSTTEKDGHLGLTPQGSWYCFAYWQSPSIRVSKNKTYLARFTVGTSAASPDRCLQFRLRANQLSNWRHWATGVVSSGKASPALGNPKTYDLMILPQMDSTTDDMQLSFDLMSFNLEDDLSSWIYLEEVSLEEISIPIYSEWQTEAVDYGIREVGYYTSIALDSNSYPHMCYCSIFLGLKYARWTGSAWETQTVDSEGFLKYASIAIDSNDHPHISYCDDIDAKQALKYARWTGTSWEIQVVESSPFSPYHVYYTSIALDSNSYPHISYYFFNDIAREGNPKYARWTGTNWETRGVGPPNMGRYSSIALDSRDYAHISFHDATHNDLKYARWTGSKWEIQTVDSQGEVGSDTSIALDIYNHPHISYHDSSNGDLKYARWTGSKWEIQTVDSQGNVGSDTSIALDIYNHPHISYYDATHNDLKYAHWTGTEWEIQTVDSQGEVGSDTSIALDSYNYPHISYLDFKNRWVKYVSLKHVIPAYYFESSAEGWTFRGNVPPFDSAVSVHTSGHIGISPQGSAHCFAFWDSPPIQIEPGKEYRARWRVGTSANNSDKTLEFRLRANQQSNWRYWTTGVLSLGGAAPSATNTKSYDLIIIPQTTVIDTIRLSFDLLGFHPVDDVNSWINLEDVTIGEVSVAP